MTPNASGPAADLVAILSGKGGSGKTTLAVNLALSSGDPVGLLDCDVEEPNSHFYIKPVWGLRSPVHRLIPEVDLEKCDSCGRCSPVCRFNAVAMTPQGPFFVPELCESCGVCVRACPRQALTEHPQTVGWVEADSRNGLFFARGLLELGCTQGPTVIRALKRMAPKNRLSFLDGPPGAACPAVETLRGCLFAVLVVEPTRFGLHDLGVISNAAETMGVPAGVVVNHSEGRDETIRAFASSKNLVWLGSIPDDRRFAEAGLQGLVLVHSIPETKPLFRGILENIRVAVARVKRHPAKQEVRSR